jgi:glycosyltransferase involved in cell wall biosynthesis
MKIVFVNQPWTIAAPPRGGDSIGIWTYQVARRLVSKADITVYGCKYGCPDYTEGGIHYRGISSKIDRLLLPFWQKLDRWEIRPAKRPAYISKLYYCNYFSNIAQELSKQQVDIIHIHSFFPHLPLFRRYNPKAKIVLHMHSEWLSLIDEKTVAKNIIYADLILSCSEFVTDKISKRFPHLADRAITVFNGVDTDYFVGNEFYRNNRNNLDRPKILYVGRISPEKGIHDLIDAFKQVVKHYPQASLDLVGAETKASKEFVVRINDDPIVLNLAPFFSGSYMEQLKRRIPSELSDRIHFVGPFAQEKLLKYYWDADVLVNSSLSESFGMSLAEAMACQIPVIATRVGGMTSVIEENKTGLLVEPANPAALAKGIIDLLGDRDRREQMGIAGNQRAKELFDWDKITEDILSNYKMISWENSLGVD